MTPENRNDPGTLGTGRRANVYGPRNGLARVVNRGPHATVSREPGRLGINLTLARPTDGYDHW